MILISDYPEVAEESTDFCLSEFSFCTNIEDKDIERKQFLGYLICIMESGS